MLKQRLPFPLIETEKSLIMKFHILMTNNVSLRKIENYQAYK